MPSIEQDYRELFDDLPSPRRIVGVAAGFCLGVGVLAGVGVWLLESGGTSERAAAPASVVASGVLFAEPYPMVVGKSSTGQPHVTLLVTEGMAAERVRALDGEPVRIEGFPIEGAIHPALTLRGQDSIHPSPIPSFAEMLRGSREPVTEGVVVRGDVVPALALTETTGSRRMPTRIGASAIPPLLESRDPSGSICYYLLAGENGGPISPSLLQGRGTDTQFAGRIERVGDLMILRVDSGTSAGAATPKD
jgi:hypothetical protein